MKSKELLLGLFAGLLLCFSPVANAQLQEIGPNNIGGRVSCVLVDGETVYAGTALGGIFKKSLNNSLQAWQTVPCTLADGSNLTLPVTSMVRHSNGSIFVGTGESGYLVGIDTADMASRGRGIWKFQNGAFTQLVDPAAAGNSDFYFVNELSLYESENGSIHRQFAATENGLYTTTDDWATYTKVFDAAIRDIEVVPTRKMLYFTIPGAIYRISNVEDASSVAAPVCITTNEPLFSNAGGNVKIAVSPSSATYLYAMVFSQKGAFTGVYLTRDQQTWLQLNTSSVTPFTSRRNGNICGDIVVDANDSKKIYIGGETIWTGKGYVDNSIYQWTKNSNSESSLNMGDYMSYVYNNPMAVHSGIKQILQAGDKFFIATNGGVYQSSSLDLFENISYGLNTVPVVDFAVCPDGSLIMGASDLASPFVAARSGEYNADINSSANIIFTGSGSQPAASQFQQVRPTIHRGLILSADGMNFGRTYNDYSDYTQTQTWTTGQEFLSNITTLGYTKPSLVLWETMNNTDIHDTLRVRLDTLGVIIRGNERIQLNKKDSLDDAGRPIDRVFNPLPYDIRPGDKMMLSHPSFFGYPFEYTFTENYRLTADHTELAIQSPFHSRVLLTAKYRSGTKYYSTVLMAWNPMDFRRVWSSEEHAAGNYAGTMQWAKLFSASASDGYDFRHVAMSRNGDAAYAAVSDTTHKAYCILRVRGLNSIELNDTNSATSLYFNYLSPQCLMDRDTLKFNGNAFFSRPVTSMTVDQRDGKDCLVVTFGGFDDSEPNVIVFDNATQTSYTASAKSVGAAKIPAYSSLVEYTTGALYIGTEDGVFQTASLNGTPNWQIYGDFKGVPVTAIHQQTWNLPSVSLVTHTGINAENNVYSKTKYPNAMYFGTYGRGIFMDLQYVTDKDSTLYPPLLDVPQPIDANANSVAIYPNPASAFTTIDLNVAESGNAMVRVYDMSGRMVTEENYGLLTEGNHQKQLNCQRLRKGVYLVNVVCGKATATTKLVVR